MSVLSKNFPGKHSCMCKERFRKPTRKTKAKAKSAAKTRAQGLQEELSEGTAPHNEQLIEMLGKCGIPPLEEGVLRPNAAKVLM